MFDNNIQNFYRGDTCIYMLSFGTGVDVTGWSVYFTAKLNNTDTDEDAVIQVSTTAGDNDLDDLANGLIYLTLSSIDTSNISIVPDTKYFYDFQRVIPSTPPIVKTLTSGKVKIMQDTTQSQ